MILYFRFWFALLRASFKPRVPYSSLTSIWFHVLPLDCASKTMNNARFLSFIDIAQHENNVQTGFIKEAMKRHWRVVYRGYRITFFKPLKMFQRFRVTSQVVSWDEKYFYWKNEFLNAEGALIARAYSSVSVRNRKDRKGVAPATVFQELNEKFDRPVPAVEVQGFLADLS